MRRKNPELMEKIRDFAGEYFRHNYESPTVREIAEAMGISKSTAHGYLVEMNEKGMLSYRNGVLDDLPKIKKTPTDFISAPLVGSISCGNPETEEEQAAVNESIDSFTAERDAHKGAIDSIEAEIAELEGQLAEEERAQNTDPKKEEKREEKKEMQTAEKRNRFGITGIDSG